MVSYSPLILVILAFVRCGTLATAEPLRTPLRLGYRLSNDNGNGNDVNSNDEKTGNSYRVPQNTITLAYLESPIGRKKRDVTMNFLPGDDEFSMVSNAPSGNPSLFPSDGPSLVPSDGPSLVPSEVPSTVESLEPTKVSSIVPSLSIVPSVSAEPTTSKIPSDEPTIAQTGSPSDDPTIEQTGSPSESPTAAPSESPSENPSTASSESLTESQTASDYPSPSPSFIPTFSNFTDDFFDDVSNSTFPSTNPSLAPSISARPSTSSPTIGDCLISEEERAAQILALLDAAGNAIKIRDLGTSQGLAADWLINQDFRKECPSEKIVQRWVIAVLYFATEGESWEKCSAAGSDFCGSEFPFDGKRRFLSDFSECEWAGITCNNDDCVTEIEFEENGLVGTIPTELGILKELAALGMERGGLSSTIPSEIGTLTNLVFLDLDFNELTGSLPTSLYSLTDLETLDLNANFLEGDIDLMGVFNNLEFLQLQNNQFTGTVPEDMGNLILMTTFNLHENLFTGTIPESVCDLRDTNGGLLKSLIADCANNTVFGPDIECDCCSSCRD